MLLQVFLVHGTLLAYFVPQLLVALLVELFHLFLFIVHNALLHDRQELWIQLENFLDQGLNLLLIADSLLFQ